MRPKLKSEHPLMKKESTGFVDEAILALKEEPGGASNDGAIN